MIARLPPVVGLAGAFASGSAWILSGAPLPPAPFLLPALFLPILLWRRPGQAWRRSPTASAATRGPSGGAPRSGSGGAPRSGSGAALLPAVLAAVLAGALWTDGWERGMARHCVLGLADGQRLDVAGSVVGVSDRLLEVSVEEGLSCAATLRVVAGGTGGAPMPGPGRALRVRGRWVRSAAPSPRSPGRAGYLRADTLREAAAGGGAGADLFSRIRAGAQVGVRRTLPTTAPLAEALVLARKDGIPPELREAFARSGTAHLLAISGFHVGVVAALLFATLRRAGVRPRRAGMGAAAGVWGYVAVLGFPDAATRAATILALVAVARLRSRPAAYAGALGTALLALLLLDPGALARPGFQLSFAGAWGLVLWSEPVEAVLRRGAGRRVPRELRGMVAAGVAATVATLPLVAWHFDRVALVGIPATLVAAPLVAVAIPGILLTLAADVVHPGLAAWLGGGVEVELHLLAGVVQGAAGLPFASAWVSRAWLLASGAGWGGAAALLALTGATRRRLRGPVLVVGAAVGLLLGPLAAQAARRGSVDVVVLDVGQGDAIAIRSPGDRWVLVDAGPASDRYDAGARVVLPFLRRHGAGALEALVLTHPDLDHLGGAPAVLEGLAVGAVVDPGRAVGKESYVSVLAEAASRGVGWWPGEAGSRYVVDGMTLEVLHPRRPRDGAGEADDDTNATSVVLLLRYGAFTALLTGDAPARVEEAVLPALAGERLEVLKVGHHGSSTSTGAALLEAAPPELAVVSVGRRNRYGHPHPSVLRRVEAAGARLLRTDRHGTVRIRGRADGSYTVSTARGGG